MIDNTIVVDLRNNSIEYIQDDSFKGLNKLKVLLLSYNNIKNISSGAFQDQKSLTYLDLAYNGLTSVNGDMWKGLINLKTLRLTGNKLEIELQGFSNLPNIKLIIIGLPTFKTWNDILLSPSTYSDPKISPEVVIEDTESLVCDSSNCWLKRLENKHHTNHYI